MIRFYFHPTPNPAKVAERHYEVLDTHLKGREFIVGNEFTIADISAWGWLDRAARVLPGDRDPLAAFPNVKRLFQAVNFPPGSQRGACGRQGPCLQEGGGRGNETRVVSLEYRIAGC